MYCDVSKVTIERTTKDVVYDMVVNKHYAGRWTGSTAVSYTHLRAHET